MSLKYFEKMVEPAALNCTLGEHSYKNDNPNDVKLSKLIQLGLKMILDGKFWYFMNLSTLKGYTPLFTSVKRLPVKVYHNCSP